MKVLLDAGSQRTYISGRIRKFLNLSTEVVEDVKIRTFGNSQTLSKFIDRILLVVKTNTHENILIKALCLPVILAYIESKYRISKETVWKISWNRVCRRGQWKGWKYCRVWRIGRFDSFETKVGWILSGCVGVGGKTQSVNFVNSVTNEVRIGGENDELESQSKRFRELESLGINKHEKSFYEEYLNTIWRNERNRYKLQLRFEENHPLIHDHFDFVKGIC